MPERRRFSTPSMPLWGPARQVNKISTPQAREIAGALTRKGSVEDLGAAAGDRYNQLARQIVDYRDRLAAGS